MMDDSHVRADVRLCYPQRAPASLLARCGAALRKWTATWLAWSLWATAVVLTTLVVVSAALNGTPAIRLDVLGNMQVVFITVGALITTDLAITYVPYTCMLVGRKSADFHGLGGVFSCLFAMEHVLISATQSAAMGDTCYD
jgi:hypothetical protein